MKNADVCAVILAGGKSRRMGFNKALLDVQGQPLIRVVAEQVRDLTDLVFISSNEPTIYDFLGLQVVPDIFHAQGPLAGLHASMVSCSRSLFLLLACDLPNLHEALLHRLIQHADSSDAVIPRTEDGHAHPLCAVYRRTCFARVDENLRLGINRMTALFLDPSLKVKWLSPTEGCFTDSDLHNLNVPDDLAPYEGRITKPGV